MKVRNCILLIVYVKADQASDFFDYIGNFGHGVSSLQLNNHHPGENAAISELVQLRAEPADEEFDQTLKDAFAV